MQLHLCLILVVASPAWQTSPPVSSDAGSVAQKPAPQQKKPQPAAPTIRPEDLPVSLDRIQRALAHTPMLRFGPDDRPVFRVQVFGERATIEDILGPDYIRESARYGSLTHQEFLDMVRPKDAQGYAAFSNREGATVAATSFLFQWTLQKAIQTFNETQDEHRRAAARQEVLDALSALEEARAKAGLSPK